MSPVSRGRTNKDNPAKWARQPDPNDAAPDAGAASFVQFRGPRRPEWFDDATENVLTAAMTLLDAGNPRQLEELTAGLLGAEMHAALDVASTPHFDWWFEDVVDAAVLAVQAGFDEGDGSWPAPYRLLHGLTAIAPPELADHVARQLNTVHAHLVQTGEAAALGPGTDWLARTARVGATGEVWQLRDVYGGRRAVIAGVTYPPSDGTAPSESTVFLFDLDVCGPGVLVHAGVYDDVDRAASAWRSMVGDAARDAVATAVDSPDDLLCLAHSDINDVFLSGSESRPVMDNFFRTRRRLDELEQVLRDRGIPVAAPASLFDDIDTGPAIAAFSKWFEVRYGHEPHADATGEVALQWLEGTVPDAVHVASPHRAACHLELMHDWADGAITLEARKLLPDWVRWNGEQSGLPEPAIDEAVAAASGQPRPVVDCPHAP